MNSNRVREEINSPSTILNINIENENPEPTVEPPDNIDIEIVIASLANNKAPGVDRIPAEIWKYGGERVQ